MLPKVPSTQQCCDIGDLPSPLKAPRCVSVRWQGLGGVTRTIPQSSGLHSQFLMVWPGRDLGPLAKGVGGAGKFTWAGPPGLPTLPGCTPGRGPMKAVSTDISVEIVR